MLTPIPHLPQLEPQEIYRASDLSPSLRHTPEAFYLRALQCAQSLWIQGLPAQAILMLNKALSLAPIHLPIMDQFPYPYAALTYLMENCPTDVFMGNPRRHWQHLATRMSGDFSQLRIARAWACWAIACKILPEKTFPADHQQLIKENITEPSFISIHRSLQQQATLQEVQTWLTTYHQLTINPST
jgi:hypothetical protein